MAVLEIVTVQGERYVLPSADPTQIRNLLNMCVKASAPQLAFTNVHSVVLVVPTRLVAHVNLDGELIYERAPVEKDR